MNKIFKTAAFVAATVLMFACSSNDLDGDKNEMVDFTVSTSIPTGIKTYGSGDGGAKNLNSSDYKFRFIMEVWTKADNGGTPRRAYRGYQYAKGNYFDAKVTFTVRLLKLDYDVIFWADFVKDGTNNDLYYKTDSPDGLKAIVMKTDNYGISNDARDAYFGNTVLNLTNGDNDASANLQRPFGKFRLMAYNDVPDGSFEVKTTALKYSTSLPIEFNALTGKVGNKLFPFSASYGSTVSETPETIYANYEKYDGTNLLAFDYIFADKNDSRTYSFTLTGFDQDGVSVGEKGLPNVPISQNCLTTVFGNFFTAYGTCSFEIVDGFDVGPDRPVE